MDPYLALDLALLAGTPYSDDIRVLQPSIDTVFYRVERERSKAYFPYYLHPPFANSFTISIIYVACLYTGTACL
jgi:hypothetical protein